MHTKYCIKCPNNLAKQCELDLGQNTMPPCAKLAVESVNSLQQLKAEIAAMCIELDCCTFEKFTKDMYVELRKRLRQFQPFINTLAEINFSLEIIYGGR